MGFESFIFKRYLGSPRQDRSISVITRISIFGVALGVMTLIVVLSVMNGFERDLRRAIQGANAHLTVYKFGTKGLEYQPGSATLSKLLAHPEVVAASPFSTNQALLMGPSKPQGSMIKGIDPVLEPQVTQMDFFIRTRLFEAKRDNSQAQASEEQIRIAREVLASLETSDKEWFDAEGRQHQSRLAGVILGSQLAKNLGVGIGDLVTLVSPESRLTPMGEMPRAKRFRVEGFFESGIMGYDEILAFVHLEDAQKLFRLGERITGFSVRLEDGGMADEVKASLQDDFPFPYALSSWTEQNRNLFAVFRLEKIGLAVILTLIILIAAFNIISSLVLLVVEKKKDIAILKAIGAKDRAIERIFVYQGTVIGLAGTLLGMVTGLLLCWLIGSFDVIDIPAGVYVGNRIPMHVEFWQIGVIALVSLLICFSVTLVPSKKAAKLDPVEGLKHE
ncbi:MAG: ABC transporter permease [bacterium]|nr:ABC transporter permease [bacterium]